MFRRFGVCANRRSPACVPCALRGQGARGGTWIPRGRARASIVATIVPLNSSPTEMAKLPILVGVVIGCCWARFRASYRAAAAVSIIPALAQGGQVALHQNSNAASCAALAASWITARGARGQK